MRHLRCAALLCASVCGLAAQAPVPTFTAAAVLPAHGSKAEPLQPGMLVSIYGRNLGPAEGCIERSYRESDELCDTTVTINGIKARLLYVQANQINLRVPSSLPDEAMPPFIVTYKQRQSSAVPVRFAPDWARISLAGKAYVHMPVWIKVELPGRLQRSARYPITIYPDDFGGHQFEVRRNGVESQRKGTAVTIPKAGGGPGAPGGIGGGSFLGLPSEPKNAGMFPVHLVFPFDEPGRYEIRYTGYDMGIPMNRRILVRSEWLTIDVRPQTEALRKARLEHLKQPAPTDPFELLSEYLPSILAFMDAAVLQKLEDALYHRNSLVRQYSMYGLYSLDEKEFAKWVPDVIRRRGPTNELAYVLSWRRNLFQAGAPQIARDVIAHLRSGSPLVPVGALQSLMFLRAHYDWKSSPQTLSRMDTAVLESANGLIRSKDADAMRALAQYLGSVKSDRSRDLLWRLVDQDSVREQALICLTWIGDRRDLPRIAAFDVPSLDYHLERAYGSAAIPYSKKRRGP